MDLVTVLSNAQSPNEAIRREAEAHLLSAEEAQYAPFLLALCQELTVETKPLNVRQLAGLHIKNLINSKNVIAAASKKRRWIECDPASKEMARQAFIQALTSPQREVGRVAAQIIANYGCVDIPQGQWPILMDTLFANVTRPDISEMTKVSSLEALGYLCEQMDPDDNVPADVVNKILGTLVDGMQASRPNTIRLAAITALNNSLDFTEANFQKDVERNMLMTSMCEATQCTDVAVRKGAYECLARVAELYYDYLQPYAPTLFQLTTAAIRTDVEDVAIPAIEFWASICEIERDRQDDIEDNVDPPPQLLNLIATAAQPLTQCILEAMTKQPEDVDEEEWNLNEAASICLDCIASSVAHDIVIPHVLPFIQQNIQSPQWNLRDAAVSAFGLILSGRETDKMKPIVDTALTVIVALTKDPHPRVRWSAVWTLAKICESHKESTDPAIASVITTFMASLDDPSPITVSKACFGINNLALACEGQDKNRTTILSPYYYSLMEKLLGVAVRPDHDTGSLRVSAYEAINALVENSALDEYPTNLLILGEAVTRLEAVFNNAAMDPKDRLSMQGSICSLIGTVIKKLNKSDMPVAPNGDRIMNLLLATLSTDKGISGNEDAAYAVGAMADLLGSDFSRYAGHLQPVLLRGLASQDDHSTCILAVGLLGDLCRALGKDFFGVPPNHCDEYVKFAMELCTLPSVDRAVKPHVIGFFSDLAMAIEGNFDRYSETLLPMLKSAGLVEIQPDFDEDTVEYINGLRSAILESYTGILQGLEAAKKEDMVGPHVVAIAEFLMRVAGDTNKTDDVLKNLVGLMGDLAKVYKAKIATILNQQVFVAALSEGCLHEDEDIVSTAKWAHSEIIQIIPQIGQWGMKFA